MSRFLWWGSKWKSCSSDAKVSLSRYSGEVDVTMIGTPGRTESGKTILIARLSLAQIQEMHDFLTFSIKEVKADKRIPFTDSWRGHDDHDN